MISYQLFLNRNEQHRLEFYQHFIDLPARLQTVAQVAQIHHLSPTSVYRTLSQITTDLMALRAERGDPAVSIKAPFKTRFNLPAPLYATYLMRHSTVGQYLIASLIHPEWTLTTFSQEMKISVATVTRRLRPLAQYLTPFGLRFGTHPIGLRGREENVRFALAELMWQLEQDGTDLFPVLDSMGQREAQTLIDAGIVPPNIPVARVAATCAVHIIRTRQGRPLTTMLDPHEVLNTTGVTAELPPEPNLAGTHSTAMSLIHLQSLLTASFHDASDPALTRMIGHHVRINSPQWQFVQLVLRRAHSLAGVDVKSLDGHVLAGNLLAITVTLDLLNTDIPDFDPLIMMAGGPPPNSLLTLLSQIFMTLPQHLQGFKRLQSAIITRFTPLIAAVMPDAQAKLRVAIDPEMPQRLYSAVHASLQRMPAVTLVTNPAYARLVVTTDLAAYHRIDAKDDGPYYFAVSSYMAWLRLEHLVHYLAIHECGLRTGSGVSYTQLDPDLMRTELE